MRNLWPLLLVSCSPAPSTEARGAHVEPILAAIEEAPSFDAAVQIALDAGLGVDGFVESSPEGRAVLIYDQADPGTVLLAVSEQAQSAPTSRLRRSASDGGVTAVCQVDGKATTVNVASDGNVYAVTGPYRASLSSEVHDRLAGPVSDAMVMLNGSGGGAVGHVGSMPHPQGSSSVYVGTGSLGGLAAQARVVGDAQRATCHITIDTTHEDVRDALDAIARGGQNAQTGHRFLQGVFQHELGHCLGLGHGAGFMAPANTLWSPNDTALTEQDRAVLRALGEKQRLGVGPCRANCGSSATYDARQDQCVCKPGARQQPGRPGCWVLSGPGDGGDEEDACVSTLRCERDAGCPGSGIVCVDSCTLQDFCVPGSGSSCAPIGESCEQNADCCSEACDPYDSRCVDE